MCRLCKQDGNTQRHPGRPSSLSLEDRLARKAARSRQWANNNPERMHFLQRRGWLAWKYGITLEEYDTLLQAQSSMCAICKMTPEQNGGNLSVDHCHKTGRVRGLLCKTCNRDIGRVERYREGFNAYLENL